MQRQFRRIEERYALLFLMLAGGVFTAHGQTGKTKPLPTKAPPSKNPPLSMRGPLPPPTSPNTLPVAPTPPKRDPGNPLLYGINLADSDNQSPARLRPLLAVMKAAGVTNTRIRLSWADVERTRGKYDWTRVDQTILVLKAQGFTITALVEDTPDWANETESGVRRLFAESDAAARFPTLPPLAAFWPDLGRFAQEAARRYKTAVPRWEFWNNPDQGGMPGLSRDTKGQPIAIREEGDPVLYAPLLNVFSRSLKRGNPNALVAVGGLASHNTDFLNGVYKAGGQSSFDAVCLHPNSGSNSLRFDWIDASRRVMTTHGDLNKKLWLTEWGWPSYPAVPEGVTEGEQARRMRESFVAMRTRPFVEMADWQTLADRRPTETEDRSEAGMGLCANDLSPKPALQIFAEEAHNLLPPASAMHRAPFTVIPPVLPGQTAHIMVDLDTRTGALPLLWRGTAQTEGNEQAPASPAFSKMWKASGVTLARVSPFAAPGVITIAEDDTPVILWDRIDAQLQRLTAQGADIILDLEPLSAWSPTTWRTLAAATLRRYTHNATIKIARYEVACASSETATRYADFALLAHTLVPDTPLGLNIVSGDVIAGARRIAERASADQLPLHSLAWTLPAEPTEAAQQTREIRRVLAGFSALKKTLLLPTLPLMPDSTGQAAYARLTALGMRLMEYAPPDQANPLGGVLTQGIVSPSGKNLPATGITTNSVNSLLLLNRMAGTRLRADSDDSRVRCLAVADHDHTRLLLWREPRPGAPWPANPAVAMEEEPVRMALVRLHGRPKHVSGRQRVNRYDADSAFSSSPARDRKNEGVVSSGNLHPITQDNVVMVPGDLEMPILLRGEGVTLLDMTPEPPSVLETTLTSSRPVLQPGEAFDLTVTVHNLGATPQKLELSLSASATDVLPVGGVRITPGMLAAGGLRAFRFHLHAPALNPNDALLLQAQAGMESMASLAVLIRDRQTSSPPATKPGR